MQYAREGLKDLFGYQLVSSMDVRSIEPIAESGDAAQKARQRQAKEDKSKKMTIGHADVTWYLREQNSTSASVSNEDMEFRGVVMTALGFILVEVSYEYLCHPCQHVDL